MRYRVVQPTKHGYDWFDVIDTQSTIEPNFAVASIWSELPNSGEMAQQICDRLNEAQ